MSKQSIALNRFGYGMRHSETAPSVLVRDPRRFLLNQLERYDPSPRLIADNIGKSGQGAQLIEMLRRGRQTRRSARRSAAMTMDDGAIAGTASERDQLASANLDTNAPEYVEARKRARRAYRSAVADRINVAVMSDTPFAERLVHFWSNHFSVSVENLGSQYEVAQHEFAAIRPHVLGKFPDLLKAAVLHPAMLIYLDQYRSIGPNSPFHYSRKRRGKRNETLRQRGLNENLAREILELHTLGVDGGYSQADVTEFARALTGWTLEGLARFPGYSESHGQGTAFIDVTHEIGPRHILGRKYSPGGAEQALAILDDLAAHPSTARFIATKFARHFAGDAPPEPLVKRLEQDFVRTGGDLASLTETLIAAPEAWRPGPAKYRQPHEWMISALRIAGVERLRDYRLFMSLNEIGQLPWRAPSPAGYDDFEASWAGPDALFRRVELAERIAHNSPSERVVERAQQAFPSALSDHTRLWLERAESGTQALALLLVSPEMMRR
ncbi:MAG: DUF1800 domain-containing protein [Pseudomonadota bacterium]